MNTLKDDCGRNQKCFEKYYEKRRLISFDAGLKNMGVCVIEYLIFKESIKNISVEDYEEFCTFVSINMIKIIYVDKWDISKFTKKHNDFVGFARGLKERLNDIEILGKFDTVIYEHQMNANHRTNVITDFIIYHFVGLCDNIDRVPGASKSTVSFSKELMYQNYASRYATNYTANKRHTEDNMKYWYKIMNKKIPNCKIDDMADAFILGLAYIFKNEN
jgi:hypothetical protein